MNESIRVVQAGVTEPEFRRYRAAAGAVMGGIYLDLIKVLVKDYPELDPGRERHRSLDTRVDERCRTRSGL